MQTGIRKVSFILIVFMMVGFHNYFQNGHLLNGVR
jgi:hypothetical protein